MIFVKSILMGITSLIVVAILSIIGIIVIGVLLVPHGTTVGIDVDSYMSAFPEIWLIPVIIFSLGFFWEYRRVRLRRAN